LFLYNWEGNGGTCPYMLYLEWWPSFTHGIMMRLMAQNVSRLPSTVQKMLRNIRSCLIEFFS
jgi:hypothetical protein